MNVEGLPELVTWAVEAMGQAFREQLAQDQRKARTALPVWPGTVGALTREDMDDDIV